MGLRMVDCGLRIRSCRSQQRVGRCSLVRDRGPRIRNRLRRGLTLVEATASMVLVGIALVGALNTVGAVRLGQVKVSDRRQGHLLAQALMSEILQQDYADPDAGIDSFGLETGEAGAGGRGLFDDVDDYHGWTSKPPEPKVGPPFAGLDDWKRIVNVFCVSPSDIQQEVGSNQGVKRINVKAKHNGILVAKLVALKTVGLPPLEACCFGDGTCDDLRVEACATEGGTSMGPDTICATTECPTGPAVLFVVTDDVNPTEQEQARIALTQSWDYQVTLILASAWQSEFDAAVAEADVAYVSVQINASDLGTKLRETPIGVVIEEMMNDFGIASDWEGKSRDEIKIIDNSHYITSPFSTGLLTYLSSLQPVTKINGGFAPALNTLAEMFNTGSIWKPALAVVDTGGELAGGGTAAARRVQLPWGADDFDFSALNADGQTIMKRAIEWAAATPVPLLLVVTDDTNPTAQELARQVLIESWGYNVTMISASAPQADLDAAVANADVAYVPVEVDPGQLAAKLKDAPIGVVNEEPQAGFGFARIIRYVATSTVRVDDNTHYITSLFDSGPLLLFDPSQPVSWLSNPLSPDMRILGSTPDGASYEPSLAILEAGDTLWDGGTAAGRRVRLPWGDDDAFDFNALNADGRILMKRAIEWAAGQEEPSAVCGDATCDQGEECTCPADCGDPAAFEEPGVTCDDGVDNDCDGQTDCDDINCPADPACTTVCGDTTCEGSESPCNCPTDCGEPASWELANSTCDDGIDNDCDGQIDCADANCTTDPTCCTPKGGHCVMDSECCSGDCNAGKNECK